MKYDRRVSARRLSDRKVKLHTRLLERLFQIKSWIVDSIQSSVDKIFIAICSLICLAYSVGLIVLISIVQKSRF